MILYPIYTRGRTNVSCRMRADEGPPQLEAAAAGIRKGGANAESPLRVPNRWIEFL